MKQARIVALSVVSGAAMLAFCTPSIANACESAVRIAAPSPAQTIASAERVLEVSPNEAARVIAANFSGIRFATPSTDPLLMRAVRVYAIALVRSNATRDNLEWSVQALRDIEKVRKNDPAVQADLGEALSKT